MPRLRNLRESTRSDSEAALSQLNRLARSIPLAFRLTARAGDSATRRMAALNSAMLRGSIRTAAPWVISGNEDTLEVMTGQPAAMACATGIPNPS